MKKFIFFFTDPLFVSTNLKLFQRFGMADSRVCFRRTKVIKRLTLTFNLCCPQLPLHDRLRQLMDRVTFTFFIPWRSDVSSSNPGTITKISGTNGIMLSTPQMFLNDWLTSTQTTDFQCKSLKTRRRRTNTKEEKKEETEDFDILEIQDCIFFFFY